MAINLTKLKAKTEEASGKVELSGELETMADDYGKVQVLIEKARLALVEKASAEMEKLASLEKKAGELAKKIDLKVAETYPSMIPVEPDSEEMKASPDATKPFTAIGKLFKMDIKPAENQRIVVNHKMLPELMGEEVFWTKVKMNLKDIDDYLNPEEKLAVVEEKKGKRKWEVTKKA